MKKQSNPMPPGTVKPDPPPAPPAQVPVPVKVEKKVLEKHNEEHLRKAMKKLGGECYKWQSMNNRGVTDRICIFPDGRIALVELKRDESCKLSPLQTKFHNRMVELNVAHIYVLKSKAEIDAWFIGMGY